MKRYLERLASLIMASLIIGLIILLWPALVEPGRGVPPRNQLTPFSGQLETWKTDYAARTPTIKFRLRGDPAEYQIASKVGGYNEITSALKVAKQVSGLGKKNNGNFIIKEPNSISVYEFLGDSKMIWSYDKTKTAWSRDDKLTPFLLFLFCFGALYFLYAALFGVPKALRKHTASLD